MDISFGAFPKADSTFGHADYYHHKNSGKSAQELLNWVNNNFGKFSTGPKNQPGGGGLYDLMQRDANTEQMVAQHNAVNQQLMEQTQSIQSNFDKRMAEMQNQMAAQQQTYQDNLSKMQNTLLAQQNPQTRQSVLGVKAAGKGDTAQGMKLRRQGMPGAFNRAGLRISSLNVG